MPPVDNFNDEISLHREYKDMFFDKVYFPPRRTGAAYENGPEAPSLGGWGVSVP